MNEHNEDPIRALIKDKKNRSKIALVRELLPSIQDAHAAGVTLERIVEELCKMDINVTYGYLRTVLYRIRKNTPKKTNKEISTPANKTTSTEKKSYDNTENEQIKPSLEINQQQAEAKKSATSCLKNFNTKLPDDFVNPLEKVMENYKKEQAENPRKDSLNFNSVPDLDKIYGNKK